MRNHRKLTSKTQKGEENLHPTFPMQKVTDVEMVVTDNLGQFGLLPKRAARTSNSARLNDSKDFNQSLDLRKKNVQTKTPILRNSSSEQIKQDKKKRLQKLGLEDFMKEISVNHQQFTEGDYSKQIFQVLKNSHLIENKSSQHHRYIPRAVPRKPPTVLKNPKIQWNPQRDEISQEFKQMEEYIPSYIFPCRKNNISRLKSRNFGSYHKRGKSFQRIDDHPVFSNPIQEIKRQINLKTKNLALTKKANNRIKSAEPKNRSISSRHQRGNSAFKSQTVRIYN